QSKNYGLTTTTSKRGTEMRDLSRRQFGALLAGTMIPIGSSALAQQSYTMKIGTATINDAQHEWIKRFGVILAEKSSGRINVEAYPSSQLGSIPRMIEQTQMGTTQGFVGPAEFMSSVDSRYAVIGAPAIFKSNDQAYKIIQDPEFKDAFLALGGNKGL